MRNKNFFVGLAILLMMPQMLFAYVNGDRFTIDNITYQVLNAAKNTVSVEIVKKTGKVTIPSTVFDGKDVTFTVVQIAYGYDNANKTNFTGVTEITIPNTVTKLGYYAFYGSSITKLHIPASVSQIGNWTEGMGDDLWAYRWADGLPSTLTTITVDANNKYFEAAGGVLYTKGKTAIICHPKGKTVTNGTFTIPNGVKKIWANAFSGVSSLKKLVIPASVNDIVTASYTIASAGNLAAVDVNGSNATYCSVDGVVFTKNKKTLIFYPQAKNANASYKIPNGCTEIARYAFYGAKITGIDLNAVTTTNYRSFASSKLTSVTISKNLKSFNPHSFTWCNSIQKFSVAAGSTTFTAVGDVLFSYDKKTLVKYPPARAATEYSIPAGTVTIGECGLQDAKKLTKITIPNTLTTIETWGMRDCTNLKTLAFTATSKLQTIGTSALWGVGLETVTFPKSLVTIGASAFYCCYSLKKVIIEAGSLLKTIGTTAFDQCTNFDEFKFNGTCTLETIGERAFADKTKMTYFNVPASVKTIGKSAFSGCKGITKVTFPTNAALTTISDGAFSNSGVKDIILPANVTTIGKEAFWNCSVLARISLSSKVATISPEAFKACYNLQRIDVDKANTKYSSADGMLLTKDKKTLVIFPPGRANDKFILLAPSITTIGEYSFYANDRLKNITLPNKVTAIGKRAFGLCPNLNTVTFLCDEMIDPANIKQALNEAAFDDGVTTPKNVFPNIVINVRKELLTQYQQNTFYKKFKSISPSFVSGTEEFIPVSDNTVDLLSTKTTNYTFVLPKTVNQGGKTYAVSLLGDYAFQNTGSAVKEVVVFDNMEYIGAKAFMTDINNNASTVENVFFINANPKAEMLSTTRFDLDDTGTDYSEIAPTTKVYVKRSALNTYKTMFARYNSIAPDMFDYKIPGIKVNNTYATFSREFDTDLRFLDEAGNSQNWDTAKNCPKVIAFTAFMRYYPHTDPKTGEITRYVVMKSIFCGEDRSIDGLYIPANTGVLLKAINGTTPTDFFYTIGEDDRNVYSGENVMQVATENSRVITPTDGTNTNFYISGGKLHRFTSGTKTVGVHKSYMKLPTSDVANTKVVMVFNEDDGSLTGISEFERESVEMNNNAWYTLDGQRLSSKPTKKGIYINNGKKVTVQ